jgi:hypothetical protein
MVRSRGIMDAMRNPIQLNWTQEADGHHAHQDKTHYHAYEVSDQTWNLAIYSMLDDKPGGIEEKLGDYKELTKLSDAQTFAQGLADQRSRTLAMAAAARRP